MPDFEHLTDLQNMEWLSRRVSAVSTAPGAASQVWHEVYDVGHLMASSSNRTMIPTPYDILLSKVY